MTSDDLFIDLGSKSSSVILGEENLMPFSPDIVVTADDTPRVILVVDTKLSSEERVNDESQLKSYMVRMRCPVGLFVTPEEIAVYRDTYTAHSEGSISRIGIYPAPNEWAVFKAPHHGSSDPHLGWSFEESVKTWLESLRTSRSDYIKQLPAETRNALSDYVFPALAQGVVRAGGPRESKIGSR